MNILKSHSKAIIMYVCLLRTKVRKTYRCKVLEQHCPAMVAATCELTSISDVREEHPTKVQDQWNDVATSKEQWHHDWRHLGQEGVHPDVGIGSKVHHPTGIVSTQVYT